MEAKNTIVGPNVDLPVKLHAAPRPQSMSREAFNTEDFGFGGASPERGCGTPNRSGDNVLHTIGIAEGASGLGNRYNAYRSPIIEGILAAGRNLNRNVIHFLANSNDRLDVNLPQYIHHCDGLLYFASQMSEEIFKAITEAGIPLVAIGGDCGSTNIACVDIDNVAAAKQATKHLIELGHRRIGMLCADIPETTRLRVAGFRQALEEASLPVDEALIVPGLATMSAAMDQASTILGLPADLRPTAIVCFNDGMAVGVYRAAADAGIRIPQDLSVVGFDDLVESGLIRPPLTTMRQPLREIGERAADLLLEIIAATKAPSHHLYVKHELVIRGSTFPPVPR